MTLITGAMVYFAQPIAQNEVGTTVKSNRTKSVQAVVEIKFLPEFRPMRFWTVDGSMNNIIRTVRN